MPVDVRSQACKYLVNGRVVVFAAGPDDFRPPEWLRAQVDGRAGSYFVQLADGAWRCSCEEAGCPHVAAVQHCTGYDGLARKPGERKEAGRD
jgi:hypothetical protein